MVTLRKPMHISDCYGTVDKQIPCHIWSQGYQLIQHVGVTKCLGKNQTL